MATDLSTHDYTPQDIKQEWERGKRVYRRLWELASPSASGERVIKCQDPRSILMAPLSELSGTLGFMEHILATVFGPARAYSIEMSDGMVYEVLDYSHHLFEKMKRCGWLTCQMRRSQLSEWAFQVRLMVEPERLDDPSEIESIVVPTKSVPIAAIDLEKAFKRLMAQSRMLGEKAFVPNPENILSGHFGRDYDAIGTIDALIDAGLAKWFDEEVRGVSIQRLYLYPPDVEE